MSETTSLVIPLTCPYYAETTSGLRNMYNGKLVTDPSKAGTGAARQWKTVNLSGFGTLWTFTDKELNEGASHYLRTLPVSPNVVAIPTMSNNGKDKEPEPEIKIAPPVKQTFSISHKEAVKLLNKKFHNMQDFWDLLSIALETGKHCFVYGAGGHAKSLAVHEYFKARGVIPFVQSCGDGLTEEKLYGGINLRKFNKLGEIEYNVHASFMYHEYVVFEELLDAPVNVLLSLKDVLTSKKLRQGSQQYPIQTKTVICLTNKSKQEVSENESIVAFLERFPLELKLEWNSYKTRDYLAMFKKIYVPAVSLEVLTQVAQLCEVSNDAENFISPRTACHIVDVVKATGDLENAKFIGGVNYSEYKKKMKAAETSAQTQAHRNVIDDVRAKLASGEPLEIYQLENLRDSLEELAPVHDSLLPDYVQTIGTLNDKIASVQV